MFPTRKYNSINEVKVGDCVQLDGQAFASCIVAKIDREAKYPYVELARPHAKVGIGGTPFVANEVFTVGLEGLVKHFEVFTRGHSGEADNRYG